MWYSSKRILFILIGVMIAASLAMYYIKKSAEHHTLKKKEWIESLRHTASKNVEIIEQAIPMKGTSQKRTLAIYLPDNYELDTVNYPVFYFLDGQSIFDEKILAGDEWQVDEVLDSLGKINRKAIAVGIYNSEYRDSEYQPNFNPEVYDKRFTGNVHGEWIVNVVKPWVDNNYRTKAETSATIIGGASFGGLMSYYLLTEYPHVFGGAIIMSPSFWVNEKSTDLDQKVENMNQKYIYLSAGDKDRGTINGAKHLNEVLTERGLNENYRFEIEHDEVHRNIAWKKMIQKSIPWMLERMNKNQTVKGSNASD